ncbi:hypothetical protein [Bosea sp. TND4EK4]|uniref:hypothetical protein n=1 Tax=Bosea sp. TND4EK4 TaxID=1907408 RepID=UPI00111553FD|nr:hypothetical protein [Bosea sp. TND4EK4]
MTEQQKRRLLLPTIRAATDCIAREAARHPDVVNGYRQNNLGPMIAEGWRACTNALVEIAVAHDNLHGSGTGLVFVKGAYSDDLPRAVRSRLQPDMDRRIAALDQAEAAARAEQARREVERQQNIERLERAADTLRDRAYDCTTDQLGKLISSSETAEVLSTAAMTICRKEIDDALQARVDLVRTRMGQNYSAAAEPDLREELRKVVRNNVVTNAVQLKAGQGGRPQAAPNPTTPAAVTPQPAPSPSNVGSAAAALPKDLRECLSTFAAARNGKFIEQRKLYEGMLELCRPEIEAAARASFLAAKDGDLAKEREKALTNASAAARQMIGMAE